MNEQHAAHVLKALALDGDQPAAPPGLADRTLAFIAERTATALPKSPTNHGGDKGSSGSTWRRWDVLVGAAILCTAFLLAIPTLGAWRSHQGKIACQDNLRQYFAALDAYQKHHGQLPSIAPDDRRAAGLIAPALREAGVLPVTASVVCPGHGQIVPCSANLTDLLALPPDEFQRQAPQWMPSYAYHLGHRIGGEYHPLRSFTDLNQPILADAAGASGNSINHAGQGQNVLCADGHVHFTRLRTVGPHGDDLYLNQNRQVAAGVEPWDTVLGGSAAQP